MPAAPSCANCGASLPKRSRFCPECGTRTGAGPGETAVQELPPEETGPVPVELSMAAPRFFGVTPPAAVLALAAASLALAIVLLVSGHVIVGGAGRRRGRVGVLLQRARAAAAGSARFSILERRRGRPARPRGLRAGDRERPFQRANGAVPVKAGTG